MAKLPIKSPAATGRAADRLAKRQVDYGLDDRLLPIGVVMEIAGIGKTMIYRKMREGTFPRCCKPGGASTRWSEREVKDWKANVMAAREA
ncbi:AlpA family phage regulatory protein [Sphingomonas sp. CARO-RG-8B-R24-01]|uniref:helix-turn-helix transcriptional regulator n=1 Tax=Sphingomonas sp. CARO-RG-8B-R24-01 TaxID=2914831 RepID=UPI001F59C0C4|nr:AlpA family phage regulatory protein [Sphingomonas sp. CARO-RG-8B-R24-01]